MPRVPAVLAVVVAVAFCIGYNAMNYPAVWEMVAGQTPALAASDALAASNAATAGESKPSAADTTAHDAFPSGTGSSASGSSDPPYCTADGVCSIGGSKSQDPATDILSGTRADRSFGALGGKRPGAENGTYETAKTADSYNADASVTTPDKPSSGTSTWGNSASDASSLDRSSWENRASDKPASDTSGSTPSGLSTANKPETAGTGAPKRPEYPVGFSPPGATDPHASGLAGETRAFPAAETKASSTASPSEPGAAHPASSLASLDTAGVLDRPLAPIRRDRVTTTSDGWEGGDAPRSGQGSTPAPSAPDSATASPGVTPGFGTTGPASAAVAAKLRRLPPVESPGGDVPDALDSAMDATSPAFRTTATP